MTAPLFLVDDLPSGELVELLGEEGRHAARVRRLTVGERLEIGDGRGSVLTGAVAGVLPDGLRVVISARRQEPAPDPRLVVVQALPKGERAELAVEVMTELGADEIVPWSAARSIVRWQDSRAERALDKWRRTAREATKQSRRAWTPSVAPLASTAAVAQRIAQGAGVVLHGSADTALAAIDLPQAGELIVVVGPEGGISPEELDAFAEAGAAVVRLGRPVLRTSTAGGAALAALSLRMGRWA